MKHILSALALLCVSCASLPTPYPNGKGGVAKATIVGGDGMLTTNADGSMAFTYKQTKSLQHVVQGVTALGVSYIGYLESVAQQVTDRFNAGQITLQQKNASLAAIEQAKLAAKGKAFEGALGAGAVPTVGPVTPP